MGTNMCEESTQREKQKAGEEPTVELQEAELGQGRVYNSSTGSGSTAEK